MWEAAVEERTYVYAREGGAATKPAPPWCIGSSLSLTCAASLARRGEAIDNGGTVAADLDVTVDADTIVAEAIHGTTRVADASSAGTIRSNGVTFGHVSKNCFLLVR